MPSGVRLPGSSADIPGLDTQLAAKLALAGGTMTGNLTLAGAPSSDLHAATKLYADSVAGATTLDGLTDVTLGTPGTGSELRYGVGGFWRAADPFALNLMDFAPASPAINTKANATETTAAFVAALALAQTLGVGLNIPAGDYLVNAGSLVVDFQCTISGAGEQRTRIFANSAGIVLDCDLGLASATGKGPTILNLGIYSERATTASGDTGIRIRGGSAGHNVAFAYIEKSVVSGFHDNIELLDTYFCIVRGNYIGEYRRHGVVVRQTDTVDSGDHLIADNWIQPTQTTSGNGYDSGGANIRLEQHAGTRVAFNKFFPGHAIGIHVHPDLASTESFPTLMTILGPGNQFDSFNSTNDCIVLEGTYGTGGTGETQHGNKLANVQIIGNNANNCGRLVDIRSEFLKGLSILANHCNAGGGIRFGATSVVNGGFIDGNYFDNRSDGSSTGGTASGFGPAKPIEIVSGASVTNVTCGTNAWVGFTSAADIADSSGGGSSVDYSPATVETALSSGTATIDLSGDKLRYDAWVPLTGNGAVKLGDDLAPGMSGIITVIGKLESGTATLAWTNPTDTDWKVIWESVATSTTVASSATAPTPANVDHDDVRQYHWRATGGDNFNYLFVRYVDCGNIAGSTDAPSSGSLIMHDTFESSTGTVHGRTPDTQQAGSTTWTANNFNVISGGYAVAAAEVSTSVMRYDAGVADGILTVITNSPTGTIFPQIVFNYVDSNDYWYFAYRMSDGFVYIGKWDESESTADSTTIGALPVDTDIEWTITIDGDDITIAMDGTPIAALNFTESGRANKTGTIIGFHNSGSGSPKVKDFKFEALP